MMENLPQDKIEEYELIRKYFDFELNEEELAVVMDRMENDEVFLERMRIFQESDEQVKEIEKKEKLTSDSIVKTIQLKPRRSNRSRWFGAIAATITLALGSVFVFWLFNNATNDPAALAESYWEEGEKLTFTNLRSSSDQTNSEKSLVEASDLFKSNDFEASIQQLSSIAASDALYHKAALLKGEAYFEQEKYEAAIQQFQIVIDHPNNEHNDLAYWYQALAYLKNGKIEQAKANLDFIMEERYAIPGAAALRSKLE